MTPSLVDLIDDWLFERFGRKWKLFQNKDQSHLWGIGNSENLIIIARINTENNTIGCGTTNLSFYDPDFFDKLEKLIK